MSSNVTRLNKDVEIVREVLAYWPDTEDGVRAEAALGRLVEQLETARKEAREWRLTAETNGDNWHRLNEQFEMLRKVAHAAVWEYWMNDPTLGATIERLGELVDLSLDSNPARMPVVGCVTHGGLHSGPCPYCGVMPPGTIPAKERQ